MPPTAAQGANGRLWVEGGPGAALALPTRLPRLRRACAHACHNADTRGSGVSRPILPAPPDRRLLPRMRHRVRQTLGKVVFELGLVFVAVLAALFANAWWEDRKAAAAGRAALAAFASEMRNNGGSVRERIDHHRAIVGNAQAILAEIAAGKEAPRDLPAVRERLTDGKGMRVPLLSRAAWDTALAADAVATVPFAVIQHTGRVYEAQRRLEGLLASLIEQMTSAVYHERTGVEATLTAFLVTFSMIVEIEAELLTAYEEWLRAHHG
ncbi:MAG: hypothetical protein ACK5S5_08965 [Planctomycetota bacterium]